jgi:hypothetical protein
VGKPTERVVTIKRHSIEFRRGPFMAKRKWEYHGPESGPHVCVTSS